MKKTFLKNFFIIITLSIFILPVFSFASGSRFNLQIFTEIFNPGSGGGGGGGGIINDIFVNPPEIPEFVSEEKEVKTEEEKSVYLNQIIKLCDFSNSGTVGISDLSILLYFFNKSGTEITRYDLNKDGKIDLFDVSIFLYYANQYQKYAK